MKLITTGLSMGVPKGWSDRTLATLIGPVGRTGFAANVIVSREVVAAGTDAEQYARGQLKLMQAQVKDLKVVDERPATVQGQAAFQRLQRFASDGRQLQQAQTFVVSGGVAFVLTYSAALEDFDAHLPALREVMASVELFDAEKARL
jgi:hypothetical protein